MTARVKLIPALLIVTAALAACGGDGEEEPNAGEAPSGGQTTDREQTAGSPTVDLDEFSIAPSDVTVERGATITAENVGATGHNLTIEQDPETSSPSEELAATSTFAGGESDTVEVDLPPGEYGLVCTVGNHRQLGMVGTLTVR